ncbi:hypothetical protein KM043_015845 [Ampulex compressa]|nr:hypothetical protein KM043_015845 [Ampulex compressa]
MLNRDRLIALMKRNARPQLQKEQSRSLEFVLAENKFAHRNEQTSDLKFANNGNLFSTLENDYTELTTVMTGKERFQDLRPDVILLQLMSQRERVEENPLCVGEEFGSGVIYYRFSKGNGRGTDIINPCGRK